MLLYFMYMYGVSTGCIALIKDYLTKLNDASNNPSVVQLHYQLQFVSSDQSVMLSCEVVGW